MTKLPTKPSMQVREALDELLRQSAQTNNIEVGDMFLGQGIFVALLKQQRVIEGEWASTERTVDLFDLMAQYADDEGAYKTADREVDSQASIISQISH